MLRYFYFHGYGSNPLAVKSIELQELVGADNVTVPHFLNDNSNQVLIQLEEIITELKTQTLTNPQRTTIVGSSMGALYALYVSCFTDVNIILLNPCLVPYITAIDIDAKIDNAVAVTELSLKAYKLYDPARVRVWVTEDDELINHRYLTKPFFYNPPLEYKIFKANEATTHGFNGFKEAFKKYCLD